MNNNNEILVFNDSTMDLEIIRVQLEAEECRVHITSHPLEAINILWHKDISVVLATSCMKGMDVQDFKQLVQKIKPGVSVFIIPSHPVNSGTQESTASECHVNLREFIAVILNQINTEKTYRDELASFKSFFYSFTDRLLQLLEVQDNYCYDSNRRVAEYSLRIAGKMGLDGTQIDSIHLAALLRDIGKICIQKEVLTSTDRLQNNPGKLMKLHPFYTIQLFKEIHFPWNVEDIIRHHHEHYDGNGYPHGLKGRGIPLGSRIIALTDAYTAMCTEGPCRKALSEAEAIREIMSKAGSQFDPEVIEIFLTVLQEQAPPISPRKRILVVDSDESVSAYLRLCLNTAEFDVFLAAGSEQALAYLEKSTPAIIIADQNTLINDGFGFYESTRLSNMIPFIIMVPEEEINDHPHEELVDYIVKPVDIDNLIAMTRTMAGNEPNYNLNRDTEWKSHGVSGTLEDMDISEIIQILSMGMKTARVILQKGNDSGELYFRNGKIVHVKLGPLTGKEAFIALIGWDCGEFRIFHGHSTDTVSITMETMTLLLEAYKELDERRNDAACRISGNMSYPLEDY